MSNSSFPSIENSLIESITLPENKLNHELFILRDDLIHPFISGNKWRKLKYIVEHVLSNRLDGIVTYGGAYSNHLVATAAAAKIYNIPVKLMVRGEELTPNANAYLAFCASQGAELEFISRSDYNTLKYKSGEFNLEGKKYFHIPEGGANRLGLLGCMEIVQPTQHFDIIALAQGTTTTSLGILLNSWSESEIWVFPVLKGFDSLAEMEKLADNSQVLKAFNNQKHRIRVFSNYHASGYGKTNLELLSKITDLETGMNFKLDPIYTGKAMIGLREEMKKLTQFKRILFVHTGGVLPL